MLENSRDVFNYFTDNAEEGDILPYLCYAIFSAEKYEWMKKYHEDHGVFPDLETEERWVKEQPHSYYANIQNRAQRWLTEFAWYFLQDEIEEEKQKAADTELAKRMRNIEKFWPSFWNSFLAGLSATVAFFILAFVVALAVFGDLSAVDFAKQIGQSNS